MINVAPAEGPKIKRLNKMCILKTKLGKVELGGHYDMKQIHYYEGPKIKINVPFAQSKLRKIHIGNGVNLKV